MKEENCKFNKILLIEKDGWKVSVCVCENSSCYGQMPCCTDCKLIKTETQEKQK